MTGTIDHLYIDSNHPLYTVKSISKDGHKTIFHIAVHKNHFKTFKTERGARAWLARWEKKP